MEKIKKYKYPIIIAIVQWIITTVLQVDRLFFKNDTITDVDLYISIKILYLLFLVICWCFGFNVYRKYKEQNKLYVRGCHVFFAYLAIIIVNLLILWPGTWAWDDLTVIQEALVNYEWYPWQHILTSVIQMVFLQILPCPGGIILIQNVIISVCVAFCIVKLEMTFDINIIKNKYIDLLVKIIPFILPPVLMYQFSGYRVGLYIYLELVAICMILCGFKEKNEWSYPYLITFAILCSVIATWRTEAFLYVPMVCILIWFMKKALTKKKRLVVFLLIVVGFFGLRNVQNNALNNNNNYKLMSTLRPLVELIRETDSVKDEECLTAINKVIDIDVVYANPSVNGEEMYWNFPLVRNGYSEEDYKGFLQAFLKLALKYPGTIIKERVITFVHAVGIFGKDKMVTNVDAAARLFWETNQDQKAQAFQNADWIANKPIFPKLRENLIYFLGQRTASGGELPSYRLIWNAIIPIVALTVVWLYWLLKRQWMLVAAGIPVLAKIPIIILTEPAEWFMYFLSTYLLGYVLIVYGLQYVFIRRKRKI